jgi:dienelactone hydrolase
MKRLSLVLLPLALLSALPARAAIKTEVVEYKQGDTVLEGFLAYDDAAKDKRPGVVVVHDWMGLSDNTRKRARELAELGYVAFAADIYGKGVRPKDGKEADALAGKYKGDRVLLRARAQAALDTLKKNAHVDAAKVAATGYCFGGTTALELARSGAPLVGVVSFHGGLETSMPADAKTLKAKVLALHGAEDPYVPAKEVEAFEGEMRAAKADWQLVKYSGAVHAFTIVEAGNDPSKGAAYNALADKRSFEAAKDFLAEVTH